MKCHKIAKIVQCVIFKSFTNSQKPKDMIYQNDTEEEMFLHDRCGAVQLCHLKKGDGQKKKN